MIATHVPHLNILTSFLLCGLAGRAIGHGRKR